MRALNYIALFVATVSNAIAQAPALRFIVDAPGPGYRAMAETEKPQMTVTIILTEANLPFEQKDISTATLMPVDSGMSQIQLTFRPHTNQQIHDYIEFNQAKPIRIEIGDYTLPLDIKKTLPWTNGVWLEARPNEKAKTILESLQN